MTDHPMPASSASWFKFVWAPWVIAALLAVALIETALPLSSLPIDDKFIVAVYARNLAEGFGWVYNLGEPVNASTSTINPILGSFAGLFGAPIPAALWWISLAAVAAAIALLLRPLPDEEWWVSWRGLWVAAMIATSHLIAATFGLESALFVLGMTLVGRDADRGRWGWAFLWSGMLCLVRGEAALIALLLFPLAWWRTRRLPWRAALWVLVPTLPWALYAWWQFGTAMPSTLEMKRLQGTSGLLGSEGILTLLRILTIEHSPVPSAVIGALVLVALVQVRRWRPSVWLFTAFGLTTAAAYVHWRIPATSYFWYAVPFIVCLLWLGGEGAWRLVDLLGLRWGGVIIASLLALCLAMRGDVTEWLAEGYGPKRHEAALYRVAGEWVEMNVPRTDRIAVTEIGQNGWHMRRPLIDLAGLISPEVGREIHRDLDLTGWLERTEPEWVLLRTYNDRILLSQLLGDPGFAGAYTQRREFTAEGGTQQLLLFERIGPVAEAAELARTRWAERMATAGADDLASLARANETLDFSRAEPAGRIDTEEATEHRWNGRGIEVSHHARDGFIWFPWIDVPSELVHTIGLRLSIERDHDDRAQVIQLYWRGVDESGSQVPRDGLVEIPLRMGGDEIQEITVDIGSHPDWTAMDRLRRLRLDLGRPGTTGVIEAIVLNP